MNHFITSIVSITLLALSSGSALAAITVSDDLFSIPSDGILLVEADGVITNDTMDDVDGSPQFVLDIAQNHTLTLITPPSEGTLKCGNTVNTICADGSFTYTVSPTSFTGVDSFTYRLEVDSGLASNELADATVVLSSCNNNGTVTTCWTENAFFSELATLEDPGNPYYVKHEGFEGVAWDAYRSYQDANLDWVYNGATTIASKGIDWSSNHPATNIISTSEGATLTGIYGLFDPDHGHATNISTGSCQALEAADPNGTVPEECLPHDGFSGSSVTTLYAVGGYIKGSNSAANISVSTDGGLFTNIGKLVTPAHQFYGIIDTNGFTSFRFHDIDGKTGQPLYIFGDDFYLVTRDPADANNAPVVGSVMNQSVAAGSLFQIDIPVSDPDNDAMAYVLSGVPTTGPGRARLIDNGSSIRVRWITPIDSAGLYPVSITVTDNGYPRITQVLNFDLTVTPPPPTLTLPGNITQEAVSAAGSVVNFSVSATDVTDGSLTPSCSAVSGSTFALGSTTVDCSVTNSNSLTTTGSFQVSIVDTTAPVVTAPAAIMLEASGATTAVSLGSASVSDLVSSGLTAVPDNTGPFAVGIHQVTWSATDTAGNTGSAIQSVTIVDTVAPSINLPVNISTEATGAGGAIVTFSASGNDAVAGNIAAVCAPASGSTFALGITAVNCSVTDGSANSASGSFNVTVVDTTLPVVTAPLNITTEATGATTAVALGTASATDLVSGSLTPVANNTGPFPVGVHNIIWSATDSTGNTGTATQTVTITDTTGPVLNLPTDFNAEATASTGAAVTYTASATDLVDGAAVINCTPASGSTFTLGTTIVSCSASDNSNHTSSGSFNITVLDSTAPVVSAPVNITLEATGATTAVSLGSASASDLVDGPLVPAANNSGPFAVGIHSIIWSATDAAGNTGTATQTVTITDTIAPTLNLPAPITAEATSSAGTVISYNVTGSDTVDGTLVADCTPVSGSTFGLGINPVNCSVTDSASLTTSGSFNISVVDTTAPAVTAPLNISVEATGATTAVTLGSASASDLVDGPLVPSASNTGPFAVGIHTVTWSATDAAGNTGTATQSVTITDTGAPVLSLPTDLSAEATSANGAIVNYSASATDLVDSNVAAICTPSSGSTFAPGTTAVSCSATDSAGQTATGSFNISVVDTTAPLVTAPVNITIEATGATTAVSLGSASANDLVDGSLIATASNSGPFAVGVHSITWSATDAANNTGTAIQTVTVTDTGGPTLTLPASFTQEATSSAGASVSYTVTATDTVDTALVPTCSPLSGSTFALGTTIVNCSVTDSANNSASGSFNITVADTTAPTVTAPLDISIEATGTTTAVNLGTASASDTVSGTLVATADNTGPFTVGVHTITWSATDAANNTGFATQLVTITDTGAPTLSLPLSISTEATSASGAVVSYSATASDIADGPITPVCTPASGSLFALGTTLVNCSVTDSANLTASGSFNVIVEDTTAPAVTAPLDITMEATGPTTAVALGTATATDAVTAILATSANNTGPFTVGVHTITWSATDDALNTGSATQTVTITDTGAPTLTLPAPITMEATSASGAIVTYAASASDIVDGVLNAVCLPASGSTFVLGTTVVNCSVTDSANLTSSASFNVTVADTTPPVVTAPLDISIEATGSTTAVNLGTASATDAVTAVLTASANNTGPFTVGVHTITWSATDDALNTGTATQTVTITDTGAPTLTLPAAITMEATGANGAVVTYTATASDIVDGVLDAGCIPVSGSTFALGTTAVNCSVTDSANLTTSSSFNVNVVDTTAPTVSAPLNITMEATGAATAVDLGVATATDAVTSVLSPLADNAGPFSVGVHTITWSATDAANNTGTATQTVTITDTGAPVLNLPGNITEEASSASGAVVNYTVTASDTVDGSLVPVCTPISGSTFVLGTTAVNCSVTDSSNLTTSAGFSVSVVDTTAPVVSAPVNITMEATGSTTALSLGTASASDLVSGVLTASANSSGPFTVGSHIITWSATDAANNTGTATQTVTITDTVAPTLNLPANISQGAASPAGVMVNYSVSANDIADGSVVPSCSPISGSTFVLGTTAVNCSASDSANNSTSGSFNVTITDTGAPTLSLPANKSAEATASNGAIVTYTAAASDAIDGPLTASCLPASGSTFALGDHVVNCSAQDLEGNSANGSFIVSIVDTTAPSVTAPTDVTVEASGATTAITLGAATATDLVNGALIPSASNSGPFTVGVHTITWSATDAANNTGTATQTVTVTDTVAPVLSLPASFSQEAISAAGAVVNYTATANDIVDGALAAACVPASGSTFVLGTTAVNCSVTDSASRIASGSFNVTVVDTTAPVVTAPANISMEATGATTVVALGSATANDSVSGVLLAAADNTGPFAVGTHTITWSATDAANNTGSATQIVTITDIGSPSLSLPANISAEATSASGAAVSYTVSASDVVDGSLAASCSPLSGSTFALGSTTVNCSATDSANLTTSGSFTVTVVDTTGPDLGLPADTSVNTSSSTGAITRYAASAIDAVDGSILPNCAPASGSNFALGTTVVTCSATDSANNTSMGSFNVTVIDITANHQPVAIAGNPQIVIIGTRVMLNGSDSYDFDGDTLTYQWILTAPTGSTAVLAQPTSATPNFIADVEGAYSVQLIVNDGTVSSAADTVLITAQLPVDAAPTISAPANIRVPSTGYLTPINLGLATATDTEDGALQPTADNTGPFATGYHEVTWSATDSGNNTVTAIQIVEVLPMVNFQLDQQAEVGALIDIDLNMNGLAPQYPVDLNYDITVNGSTSSNTLSIASGKTAIISYQIPVTSNAGDTITLSLNSATNAVIGANSNHSISLIDTNVAPIVDIEVTQNSLVTKNVHVNAGLVNITARIKDDNQGDTHTLDWSTTDNNLTVPGSVMEFTIDPSSLIEANYKIGVKVVDSGLLEAENEIYVRVITQDFNPPAGSDSDGDGVEDVLEGDQDDDNDGVPNYLDAIDDQPELLQMQAVESSQWVLATEPGLSLRLGKIAQLSEKFGASLSSAELAQFASLGRIAVTSDPNDSDYTPIDGYLDFTINGLTTPGQSVKLVIPLLSPIPDQAVYRKYSPDTGWSTFVEDTVNALASAPGADGICPAPGSSDYQTGLTVDHHCIQMTIQDGGPNDNDLLRNGVITDPGGVAVAAASTTTPPTTTPSTTTSSGGGGGGALGMPILFSMMLLLAISIAFRFGMVRSVIIGGGGREREFE